LLDPYVEDSLRKGAEKAKDKLGTQSYINGVWGSGDKGYGGNPAVSGSAVNLRETPCCRQSREPPLGAIRAGLLLWKG
jgi:hypothetical protein